MSSCTKEDNKLTIEEVLTSQIWVIDSYGIKDGTHDPDHETAEYENLMEPCHSKLLLSFLDDGTFVQNINDECIDYNMYEEYAIWEYNEFKHYDDCKKIINFLTADSLDFQFYCINTYSKNTIELYQKRTHYPSEWKSVVTITLIPFKEVQ